MTTSWALLIDAENIPERYAERLLDIVRARGEIATARVYGNFLNLDKWLVEAGMLGISVRHLSPVSCLKNAADIALAVDAMNLLHSGFPVGFCIASSDSDFVPLALEMKASGRRVIGAGMRPATDQLKAAFHDWHELDPAPKPVAKCTVLPAARSAPQPAAKPAAAHRDDQFVEDVIEAMSGAEWIHLGKLGNNLIRNGRPKGGGRLRDRLKTAGFQERTINGGYEIARPP